jgi:hypothetical protein
VRVGLYPHIQAQRTLTAGRQHPHQCIRAEIRHKDAEQPARRGKQQRFGQHLPHQPQPPRAQRNAHCHFPLPRRPARQQHTGDIRARQQQ